MRHRGRDLDQALDAAEALRQLEDLVRSRRTRPPPRPMRAQEARPSRRSRASAARRARGPGAPRAPDRDPLDLCAPSRNSATAAAFSQCRCIRTRERLQPAQDEVRTRTAPARRRAAFCRNASRSASGRVVRHQRAADDIRVAAEVLRRRVDDDVGAELERPLEVRRRERVVDDERPRPRFLRAPPPRGCRRPSSSGSSASRPTRSSSAASSALAATRRSCDADSNAVALGAYTLSRIAERPAVDVVAATTWSPGARSACTVVVAPAPTRTRSRASAPSSAARQPSSARRVGFARARVVVALVLAESVLRVRGGLVDRAVDRAGRRVGGLPRVDRERLEVHYRPLA